MELSLIESAAVGLGLLLALVCCAKGKLWLALLFFLGPLIVGIGAVRLAKPMSPWANRFYSAEKMRLAVARFPDEPANALERGERSPTPLAPWVAGLCIAVAAVIGGTQA